MQQYLIKGGRPLKGTVEISGSKNAALGLLAAAIMCDEPVVLKNLPNVNDIRVFLHAIESIGATVTCDPDDPHKVTICGAGIKDYVVDNEFIRKIRASYYLVGAMLGKYGQAKVAMPGGCTIGERPIDQHRKGFEKLGAEMWDEWDDDSKTNGKLCVKADHLHGEEIYLDMPSVGATINIMLAASMADGRTTIINAAMEPHVVDVARFLVQMGADIRGAGTGRIRINGVKKFHGGEHDVIPDQIEAGTFMCAAVATRGDVTLTNVIPEHLDAISAKLRELGATIIPTEGGNLRVIGPKVLRSTNVITKEHPGFPTDMQSQIAVCLSLANGVSKIQEMIFESRFQYVPELIKMGAKIKIIKEVSSAGGTERQREARFMGVESLKGADVVASDLRAGAALVIAGLAAEGETRITEIQYIQRGYENFSAKIRKLGGRMERIDL